MSVKPQSRQVDLFERSNPEDLQRLKDSDFEKTSPLEIRELQDAWATARGV